MRSWILIVACLNCGSAWGEVYWASSPDAIAAGTERCKKFNSKNVEEQLGKLKAKYGSQLVNEKIVKLDDDSLAFFAERNDPTSGQLVKYAYFDSLAACSEHQKKQDLLSSNENLSTSDQDTGNQRRQQEARHQELRSELDTEECQKESVTHDRSLGTLAQPRQQQNARLNEEHAELKNNEQESLAVEKRSSRAEKPKEGDEVFTRRPNNEEPTNASENMHRNERSAQEGPADTGITSATNNQLFELGDKLHALEYEDLLQKEKDLEDRFKKIEAEVSKIRAPSFFVRGDIVDRSEDSITIYGTSIPSNGDYNWGL